MKSTLGLRICWAALLLIFFYATGIPLFVKLEREAELAQYAENRRVYERMKELYSFKHCKDEAFEDLSFCKDQEEFSAQLKDYFNKHGNSLVDLEQWTPLGSAFYLTHLSTTIGYGTAHVLTSEGQVATVIYALIGIPIMGYTLAQVAQVNLKGATTVVEQLCCLQVDTVRRQMFILWCLLLMFLFGGALVYAYVLEPWSYLESLYFCWVTLATIGFGDFLPSTNESKMFSIFYIILGLGICASFIAVLTGMVAETHSRSESFLTQKIQENCADCCCTDRERPPAGQGQQQ
eukprot:gnl/TRDRNA2_/TRDRNA2_192918_c0_seq1.p1 gnl/TRDRNA2_/TRDRNA2_192918_c0~~gnl/TRDRNA2_/TRDRNA2_192918_c0_seq1.p1  ORF type:complete len:291 (-),score=59.20 gnl/TRDRNA2_/TRDRNA2_192918_c0_seq1:52-924(-)